MDSTVSVFFRVFNPSCLRNATYILSVYTIDKEICKEFNGKVIYQRTPLRVSSSRSDLVRERRIAEMSVECRENGDHILTIEAEAGTYIKELISGDDGRTSPSLAEKLGTEIRIRELDVIMIKR